MRLLHTAYYQLSQTDNAAAILEDIVSWIPEVTELPHHELFKQMENINSLISLLRQNCRTNEADMLGKCAISVIFIVGAEEHDPSKAYLLVSILYQNGNCTEAVKLGTHTLQQALKSNQTFIQLLVVVGLAKFYCGNYSEALDDFEKALTYMISNYSTNLLDEYWICCFYLIPRFKYIYPCFVSKIISYYVSRINWMVYLTYTLPFKCFNTRNIMIDQQLVLSSTKEMVVSNSNNPITLISNPFDMYNKVSVIASQKWLDIICYMTLKHPVLSFLLNVLSVFVRLHITLYIFYVFMNYCFMLYLPIVWLIKKIKNGYSSNIYMYIYFSVCVCV